MTWACSSSWMSGGAVRNELVESPASMRECLGVAQQSLFVVVAQHQALHREGELLGVQVRAEVTFRNGRAGHGGDDVQPVPFVAHHRVAHRTWPVVVLDRR